MANPLDCNGVPLPWSDRPCTPGDVDVPICYTVPPDPTILPGVKRITLTAQCTASASVILDEALVPVPGAVEVGCASGSDCECLPSTICTALQALPVQAVNIGDTAVFVGAGGCFLGVPIGGGGVAFPVLAPNGSCAAPSYSFAASPDSGMFYTGTAVRISDDNCADFIEVGASINLSTGGNLSSTSGGNTAETTGGNNTRTVGGNIIDVGSSVSISASATSITLASAAASFVVINGGGVFLNSSAGQPIGIASGSSVGITSSAGFNISSTVGAGGAFTASANGSSISIGPTGIISLSTVGLTLAVTAAGEITLAGNAGVSGQLITSNGPGVAPTWQTPAFATSAQVIWGAANISSAADTRVVPVGYDDTLISTQTPKGYSAPRAGTFRNMRVRYNTANGNGASAVWTLRVNGVLTALTVTLATGAMGVGSNLVNTVPVAAGDLIEMVVSKAASIGSGVLEAFVSAEFA